MQGDTTTRALHRRMVVALARATHDHDHATATALRATLAVLANAEAVRGRSAARDRPLGAPRAGLSESDVLAVIAAEAAQRDRAAERYRSSGDLGRAHRMQDEAEVLRAFLD